MSTLLFAAAPVSAQSSAQQGDPRAAMLAEAKQALAPFAWLVGEWEGDATVHLPNGGKMSLVQKETVTSAAFGTALIIQGRGTMTRNGAAQQVWDAAALFSYNAPSKSFSFTSAGGSGMSQTFSVQPQGEAFTWFYTEPNGSKVRYVITRTSDDKWKEIGERSEDGGTKWTTTIEMLLSRKR